MIKGVIFDTEEHAKIEDRTYNKLNENATHYYFQRVPLTQTTTLSKSDYANLFNIPEMLSIGAGSQFPNPKYQSLKSSYTLSKYAVLVGDSLDVYDDDGNFVKYASPYDNNIEFDVVDVSDLIKYEQKI